MTEKAQQIWDAYCIRIKARRLAESEAIWEILTHSGDGEEFEVYIDFKLFGNRKDDVDALATQLSENYGIEVEPIDDGYWLINGTSRPIPLSITKSIHQAWVEFMVDVAQSHACVFSTWTLEATNLEMTVCSKDVETDVD